MTRNLGIGWDGVAGGLIATTSDPSSFTVLFLVDAATFLVVALAFVAEPAIEREERPAGPGTYVDVLRHRVFVAFVALNVVFVAAGYAQLEFLPAFAKNEANVSQKAIGLIFANTLFIVIAQLPVSKLVEGRRRMATLAVMSMVWAGAWLVVLAAGLWFEAVAAALVFGFGALFALGVCFQGPVQGALVADLAPASLRGRYMAVSTTSWQLGFVIGPSVGGVVLDAEPLALWPVAALACLGAAAGSLALESRIPRDLRLTPA